MDWTRTTHFAPKTAMKKSRRKEMARTVRIAIALSFIFMVGACKGGSPEGTYEIDKDAVKKAIEAEIAKMPKEKQAMAKGMAKMFESMKIEMKLEKGGKATMNTEMSFGGKTKKDNEAGTWKVEGKKITLAFKKKPKTCDIDGSKITCTEKGMPFPMVFKKK
jgi:hypothetical protein